VDGMRGDEKFLTWLRVDDVFLEFEFHLPFNHNDQFVGIMCKILPCFSWRINPELKAKTAFCPAFFYFLID